MGLSNFEWIVVHDNGEAETIVADSIEEVVEQICVNDPQPAGIIRGELK